MGPSGTRRSGHEYAAADGAQQQHMRPSGKRLDSKLGVGNATQPASALRHGTERGQARDSNSARVWTKQCATQTASAIRHRTECMARRVRRRGARDISSAACATVWEAEHLEASRASKLVALRPPRGVARAPAPKTLRSTPQRYGLLTTNVSLYPCGAATYLLMAAVHRSVSAVG